MRNRLSWQLKQEKMQQIIKQEQENEFTSGLSTSINALKKHFLYGDKQQFIATLTGVFFV